jgi:hypothetical protein
MNKYQRLSTNDYKISTNSYVRKNQQIMQNKANFMRFSPENGDFTKNKPNQSQFWANIKGVKAKTNHGLSVVEWANFGLEKLFWSGPIKLPISKTDTHKAPIKCYIQAFRLILNRHYGIIGYKSSNVGGV